MANPAERWEDNTPGNWYVDKSCILCSLCVDLAPNNFKESEAGDHDMVFKQPTSDEEMAQCKEAMEQCPVEAIGSNS